MRKLLTVGLLALALVGCSTSGNPKRGYFYVASTEGGYRVASDDGNLVTRYYTLDLTVEQAKAIADKLNAAIPTEDLPN